MGERPLRRGDIVRAVRDWGPLVDGRLYFVSAGSDSFVGEPILFVLDERAEFSVSVPNRPDVQIVEVVQAAPAGEVQE